MRVMIFALALLAGGALNAQQQTVGFTTADACRLEAFYLAPSSGAFVFINTHGLGSSKNEWAPLQQALRAAGHGYLSLDLRGHNRSLSCGGRPADYRRFTRRDWAAASGDITAAALWLVKKGIAPDKLVFCGASIGANLSLKAAAQGPVKPGALVLLSPGLDYAGVLARDYFPAARPRTLLVAAPGDSYAWQSSGALARLYPAAAVFADGISGHGAQMLSNAPVLPAVLAWLEKR
ncbi:MAG: alpha/beta fold hydrolase [Elusimicrobiales bacterium]|nr:alpha/beta fold hydrolase [Elusimicrobiales bacterium]